ncbi:MAG: ABC transporter substrate-binding protein [Bacteroidales bacterium]|nr:ABC transporter substrate-binding protein [Bacteroidales bacterium]
MKLKKVRSNSAHTPPPTRLLRIVTLLITILVSQNGLLHGLSNDKIILHLNGKHQFQFAGYYAALEKGFYEEAALDVEIKGIESNTTAIDEVLAGRAHYGIANSELLVRYMNGSPLVALAPIFQSSPSAIVVRENSGIVSPQGFFGKSIEIDTKGGGNEVLAMLYLSGIKPSQIKVVDATLSLNNLLNSKVDATAIYQTNEPFFLEKFGIPFRLIIPKNYGIDFYAECLFTSQSELKKHRSRTERFIAASIRGWDYALKNKEEIARLIQTKYKSTKTIEHLLFEAEQVKKYIQPDFINIGHSNKGRWLHMAEVLSQVGIITTNRSIEEFLYKPNGSTIITTNKLITFAGIILCAIAVVLLIYLKITHKSFGKKNIIIEKQQQKIEQQEIELTTLKHNIDSLNSKAVELERFNESLTSNLSFEIRSPLNNILGYCELLNAPHLKTGQIRQYTKEIAKSGQSLQHQIENLIELSKIQANQYKQNYQRINLFEFLSTLHMLTLNELKLFDKEHITIKTAISEEDIDFDILSDRSTLRNIFVRLISNAVKFTSKGYIELGCKKNGNGNLLFWIQDSGLGITSQKVNHVFTPFAAGMQDEKFSNLGLGLPIAKGLTDILGGKIWIDTLENSGTTVNICIPATPVGTRSSGMPTTPYYQQQDPPDLHTKSILIVEDIQSNFILLSKMLEETGCKLLHAKTGEEAINTFNDNPAIDLIFMDLRLIDMDGIEITRKIRLTSSRVIIIAQTAYSSGIKVNLSIEAGCNDFITKPISRLDLFNILRKYLTPKETT